MKIKVKFFDRTLIKSYLETLTVGSLFCSFLLIAFELPDDPKVKIACGIGIIVLLVAIYVVMWLKANTSSSASLNINNSVIDIKVGDIFDEQNSLKVIAFNEYFDTLVDNKIIAESTLNGIFLKSHSGEIDNINQTIENNSCIASNILELNKSRKDGKKKKFVLGTVCPYNDYLLTAFSKFDQDNRAYLEMSDYVNFLLKFWNEIDIIYAGRPVSIPLLGSGITRFKEYSISEQELLELLIWSFKVSRVKFTYPSKVSIVIHQSKSDKINFYKLKEC